jgi:hypothetical protein
MCDEGSAVSTTVTQRDGHVMYLRATVPPDASDSLSVLLFHSFSTVTLLQTVIRCQYGVLFVPPSRYHSLCGHWKCRAARFTEQRNTNR